MKNLKERSNKVLVSGTIAVDLMLYVDKLPHEDGFAIVSNEIQLPGGSSANVSADLNLLGCKVVQSGKIANDKYGRFLLEDFKQRNIDPSGVVIEKDGTTLHTFIVVDASGEHFIIANGGNDRSDIKISDLPLDIYSDISVFYTDMCWPETSIQIAKECRENNIPVVFNLQNPPNSNTLETMEKVTELLKYTDLFLTSQATVRTTIGIQDADAAFEMLTDGYSFKLGKILTKGVEGANWLCKGDEVLHCDAVPVETVDTTGAGDAYIAALINAFFINRKSKNESMQIASELSSIKCTQQGARLIDDERLRKWQENLIS